MEEGSARRGSRGWGALVGLALVAATLWAGGNPFALVGFPLALVLLVRPPRRAPQLLVALLAILVAAPALGVTGDALWLVNGLWPALLAVWFVVALYALPRSSLTMRALAATAATAATVAVLAAVRPDLLRAVDATIAADLKAVTAANVARLKQVGVQVTPALVEAVNRGAQAQLYLAPALAALASVAALAVAWWLYRRLMAAQERPLAPMREFRFRDELIWLLIAGILLVLIPGLGAGALRAGTNLLTFMGALYALRGVAVLVAMTGGMSAGGVMLGLLVALIMPPLAATAAVLVGLSDTWLDLRARMARAAGPGNNGVKR